MGGFGEFLVQNLGDFWTYTGIYNGAKVFTAHYKIKTNKNKS